jgi:hypothetical protein
MQECFFNIVVHGKPRLPSTERSLGSLCLPVVGVGKPMPKGKLDSQGEPGMKWWRAQTNYLLEVVTSGGSGVLVHPLSSPTWVQTMRTPLYRSPPTYPSPANHPLVFQANFRPQKMQIHLIFSTLTCNPEPPPTTPFNLTCSTSRW